MLGLLKLLCFGITLAKTLAAIGVTLRYAADRDSVID